MFPADYYGLRELRRGSLTRRFSSRTGDMFWNPWSVLAAACAAFPLACGGSVTPAESPNSSAPELPPVPDSPPEPALSAEPARAKPEPVATVPTECHKPGNPCLPDPRFVKRLCQSRNPSVALYLFSNGSWERGYLTRKTEAWNASGGASPGGFVEFDEEVLLLFERKADAGGMQVSGAGAGYDALRWDGSCVTLSGEEVTRKKPPSAKTPRIDWRFLDDNIQEALRKSEPVNQAYLERRKECKGASSGTVSQKCVKTDAKLTQEIAQFVRSGGPLPVPTTLP